MHVELRDLEPKLFNRYLQPNLELNVTRKCYVDQPENDTRIELTLRKRYMFNTQMLGRG